MKIPVIISLPWMGLCWRYAAQIYLLLVVEFNFVRSKASEVYAINICRGQFRLKLTSELAIASQHLPPQHSTALDKLSNHYTLGTDMGDRLTSAIAHPSAGELVGLKFQESNFSAVT
ncbi:hypothetical protein K4039_08725 [Lyngbya sp. CCAP 1446/10]|uniref:hypothetical protein n=1 Tax=Lyngbya sp. CCAP 1446/10 TaxID=439293 RepID=UPI0022377D6C|nr:hypothetical protein [Lyngbya sp. CCAP 1446/10]MCW6050164.1 hypothetical protein [Lyngbya sp. CCAP 1446/10]